MITDIDADLLEKIADLTGKPVGAFNIRKDSGCEARQSTEHIAIDARADGKPGIDIRIKAGTKGEKCYIPVIISKTGLSEMVYNDFYVADDCDVDIIAKLRHPQLRLRREPSRRHPHLPHRQEFPRPLRGEALRRKRSRSDRRQHHEPQDRGLSGRERHHADGDDPDPGHRLHQARDGLLLRGRSSEVVVTERLLTHGAQEAESDMRIELNGHDAKGRVISPLRGAGQVPSGVPPRHGGQRPVLRPRPVRLHHHGRRPHRVRSRHHRQLSRRPADPRGRHRQDRLATSC